MHVVVYLNQMFWVLNCKNLCSISFDERYDFGVYENGGKTVVFFGVVTVIVIAVK